jgi:hypothetical protein
VHLKVGWEEEDGVEPSRRHMATSRQQGMEWADTGVVMTGLEWIALGISAGVLTIFLVTAWKISQP